MSAPLEKLSGLSDRHVLKIQRPWFSSDDQREVTLGTLAEYFAGSPPTVDNATVNAAIAENPAATRAASGAASQAALEAKADLVAGVLKDDQVPTYLATKGGEGVNFIVVDVSAGDPLINGANLLAAYTAAKTLMPNGAAQSATNPATVFLPPAIYRLPVNTPINIDSPFIQLVGVSPNRDAQRIEGQLDNGTGLGVVTVQESMSVSIYNATILNAVTSGAITNTGADASSLAVGDFTTLRLENVALLKGVSGTTTRLVEPYNEIYLTDCVTGDGAFCSGTLNFVVAKRCTFGADNFRGYWPVGSEGVIHGIVAEDCTFGLRNFAAKTAEDDGPYIRTAVFKRCELNQCFGNNHADAGWIWDDVSLVGMAGYNSALGQGVYTNCRFSGAGTMHMTNDSVFKLCDFGMGQNPFFDSLSDTSFRSCTFTSTNLLSQLGSSFYGCLFVDCVATGGTWGEYLEGETTRLYNCIKTTGTFAERTGGFRLKNCWEGDTLINDPV